MADYGLAAALGEKRQRRLAENGMLRSGLAVQQFDTSAYDLNPWENLLVQALKGFTGGAMQGYGQQQIDNQFKTDSTDLVTALKGEDPAMAISENPNLAEFGPAFAVEQAADDATLRRQIKAEKEKQLAGLQIEKGITVGPDGKPQIDEGYSNALNEARRREEAAKARGQADAAAGTFITDPEKRFAAEQDLRTKFEQKEQVKNFAAIHPIYQSLASAVNDESPANSLNYVYGVANLLDPGSVVKEGETLQIVRSGGLPSVIQSYIAQVNGSNQLDLKQRQDLLAMAANRYDKAKELYDFERTKVEEIASSYGLDPKKITTFPETQGAKDRLTKKGNVDLKAMSKALQQTESNNDPKAVSPKGAEGVMQLMPENSRKFGVQDPFDPAQNIAGGEKLLEEEIGRFGDPALVIAAYNAGSPRVLEAIRKSKAAGGGESFEEIARFLPAETVNHVRKTMPLYQQFSQAPAPAPGPAGAPGPAPVARPGGGPPDPSKIVQGETMVHQGFLYQRAQGGWKKLGKVK